VIYYTFVPTNREKIEGAVREALASSQEGLRYSELVRYIKEKHPEIKENTIHGALHSLRMRIRRGEVKDITMPERGMFRLVGEGVSSKPAEEIKEQDLYQPFAQYLIDELEECSKAVPLGGKVFDDKWGTPDVFGIYRFPDYEPIKLPVPEIVSAEIKLDPNQLVVAFGQACAYKLFSHKVYLVVPKGSEEIGRLESLCLRFGLGLILFEIEGKESRFYIRTRAVKSEPDYMSLNEYLNKLKQRRPDIFKELFG
jgi:hypothetical protein